MSETEDLTSCETELSPGTVRLRAIVLALVLKPLLPATIVVEKARWSRRLRSLTKVWPRRPRRRPWRPGLDVGSA